jgi:hypothetical protein
MKDKGPFPSDEKSILNFLLGVVFDWACASLYWEFRDRFQPRDVDNPQTVDYVLTMALKIRIVTTIIREQQKAQASYEKGEPALRFAYNSSPRVPDLVTSAYQISSLMGEVEDNNKLASIPLTHHSWLVKTLRIPGEPCSTD